MKANRYVSFLTAEIEPRAIANLSQFERMTEKAFARIDSFSNRGASKMGLSTSLPGFDGKSRANVTATEAALRSTNGTLARTDIAMRKAGAGAGVAATGFARSAQSLTVVQGALGPLAGRLSALGGIFRDLSGISLAGVLGGAGAFALLNVASSYQQVTDRLRPFYDTQVQTNAAMRDVIQIARDTRQALDPVAQLYTKLTQAGKDAGITTGITALTTTVAKAARLSGGDADTQKNGLTQFAQGFGSGTLSGDELKSIRENTFRLAKAIAEGLGVPISKLKELGAAGKLTPKVIAEAMARSADQIDLEFSRLPKRIGSSLTEAGNAFTLFIGRLDEQANASSGIASTISAVGNNLPVLVTGLSGVVAAFTAVKLRDPFVAIARNITVARDNAAQYRNAVSSGRATPLTPNGIARAKSLTNVATTGAAANAATADVAARRASVVAIEQQVTALKVKQAADLAEARTTSVVAQTQVGYARTRAATAASILSSAVAGDKAATASARAAAVQQAQQAQAASAERLAIVRKEVVATRSLRLAAERRVTVASTTATTAAADPSLNRANRARITEQAVRAQALAEAEVAAAMNAETAAATRLAAAETELAAAKAAARTATSLPITVAETAAKQALAVANAELVVAEGALAVAISAEAAAQGKANTTGFASFVLTEQRLAAERAVTVAIAAETAANVAAAAALEGLTVAQRAYNATVTVGQKVTAGLTKAGSALSGLLGGPLGIALTIATVAMVGLASRTSAAQDAMDRFSGGQEALQRRLGLTIEKLGQATNAAREFALATAQGNVQTARADQRAAQKDLAGTLGDAAANIDLFSAQGRKDFADLNALSTKASSGLFSFTRDFGKLAEIQKRNSKAFESNGISSFLGSDPASYAKKAAGVAASNITVTDSVRELAKVQERLAAAPLPPILGTNTKGRTKSQLMAAAAQDAAAVGTIKRARADYAATKADLDAQLANKTAPLAEEEYVKQLSAAKQQLNAAEEAERARTKAISQGAAARRAAVAEATRDEKAAIARGEKLADIRAKYDVAPPAVDVGNDAKRQVDAFFRKTLKGGQTITLDKVKVGDKIFTQADATALKAQIDQGVRQPITDVIEEQGRELQISQLILAGREDEADLLRQKFDAVKKVGDILPVEEASLRRNAAAQRRINDQIAERTRLIDINATAIGDVQGALRDAIAGGVSVKTIKDLGKNLQAAFRNAVASRISVSLFGDAEQKYRDKMTKGLNDSGAKLTDSATALTNAAAALTTAATAQQTAATAGAGGAAGPGYTGFDSGLEQQLSDNIGDLIAANSGAVNDALGVKNATTVDADGNLVVTASRRKPTRSSPEKIDKPEALFNQIGKDFGSKVFGPGSVFTKATAKLGTFLSGAGYGQAGDSLVRGAGGRGSSLGSAIGGGLAKSFGTDLAKQGLTAISSSLGQFAGPLAGIAGGVVGSLIGGALKKTKKASATITSVDGDASVTGNSKAYQAGATGLAKNVQGGIQGIIDALGGSSGAFNVSIGQRKKKFVVDASGGGRTKGGGTTSYDTEEEASAAAIYDAILDGAVKGVKKGSLVLLKAGKDTERQLAKAVKFEGVFTALKQIKDPVGAAVDALNKEFTNLIDVFNEAGASTAEFADLQELYDLRRADAIKSATDTAVSALQDFIDGNLNTADSPLGKGTVLKNARGAVDAFRDDIAAGKAVDADKLVEALTNFQDASRAVNGSRKAFYSDFDDIMALAQKANADLTGASKTTGPLAASPFDPAVKATLKDTLSATQALAQTTAAGLADVVTAIQNVFSGGNGKVASSLGYLPSQLR